MGGRFQTRERRRGPTASRKPSATSKGKHGAAAARAGPSRRTVPEDTRPPAASGAERTHPPSPSHGRGVYRTNCFLWPRSEPDNHRETEESPSLRSLHGVLRKHPDSAPCGRWPCPAWHPGLCLSAGPGAHALPPACLSLDSPPPISPPTPVAPGSCPHPQGFGYSGRWSVWSLAPQECLTHDHCPPCLPFMTPSACSRPPHWLPIQNLPVPSRSSPGLPFTGATPGGQTAGEPGRASPFPGGCAEVKAGP